MGVSSILGKSGAIQGAVHNATPFKFGKEKGNNVDANDFFARQLETAGYNYYSTDTMYSGMDGVPMKASVFREGRGPYDGYQQFSFFILRD